LNAAANGASSTRLTVGDAPTVTTPAAEAVRPLTSASIVSQLPQDRARALEKELATAGQRDAVRMPYQQRRVERALEIGDAAAERRLGDVQSRSRAFEASRQGDLGEVANLPDVHGIVRGLSFRHRSLPKKRLAVIRGPSSVRA
jgi:hypothetical protein